MMVPPSTEADGEAGAVIRAGPEVTDERSQQDEDDGQKGDVDQCGYDAYAGNVLASDCGDWRFGRHRWVILHVSRTSARRAVANF